MKFVLYKTEDVHIQIIDVTLESKVKVTYTKICLKAPYANFSFIKGVYNRLNDCHGVYSTRSSRSKHMNVYSIVKVKYI